MIKILAIIVINVILYWRTIFFDYIIDDIRNKMFMDEESRDMYNKWSGRWFVRRLYGCGFFKNMKLDHALTIFLHTTICVLIYLAFGANRISFVASLLYSVNPVNNQTAIWCNGRRYAINIILVLLMYIFKPLGFVLYPLTPLFQINAIFSPLLLLGSPYWYLLFLCPLFFLFWKGRMLAWFKSRYGGKRIQEGTDMSENHSIKPAKLILMVKTLGYYATHCLFPSKLNFYSKFLQLFGVTKPGTKEGYKLNGEFWLGILWVLFSICSIIIVDKPMYTFGLFWFHLFILQWCNFITVTQTVADRYASLPNIGLMLALSALTANYPIILTAILVYYSLKTLTIFPMYKSIDNFYTYHVHNYPESIMGTLFYSKVCKTHGMYFHSHVALLRSLTKHPDDYRLNYDHAELLNRMNLKEDARSRADHAKKVLPEQTYCTEQTLLRGYLTLDKEIGK